MDRSSQLRIRRLRLRACPRHSALPVSLELQSIRPRGHEYLLPANTEVRFTLTQPPSDGAAGASVRSPAEPIPATLASWRVLPAGNPDQITETRRIRTPPSQVDNLRAVFALPTNQAALETVVSLVPSHRSESAARQGCHRGFLSGRFREKGCAKLSFPWLRR